MRTKVYQGHRCPPPRRAMAEELNHGHDFEISESLKAVIKDAQKKSDGRWVPKNDIRKLARQRKASLDKILNYGGFAESDTGRWVIFPREDSIPLPPDEVRRIFKRDALILFLTYLMSWRDKEIQELYEQARTFKEVNTHG